MLKKHNNISPGIIIYYRRRPYALGGVGMQIFYIRKSTVRWVIAVVVAIILAIIIWKIFALDAQQSQDTLMVAQLVRIIN